jgi:hypothetical protein
MYKRASSREFKGRATGTTMHLVPWSWMWSKSRGKETLQKQAGHRRSTETTRPIEQTAIVKAQVKIPGPRRGRMTNPGMVLRRTKALDGTSVKVIKAASPLVSGWRRWIFRLRW